jgi:hypothetical protein
MAKHARSTGLLRTVVSGLLVASALAVPEPAAARVDPVVVDAITPAVAEPGAAIEVRGSGFTGASAATVNGVAAAVNAVSDDRLTVTLPAGATSGPVAVTAPAGTGTSGTDLFVARSPWRASDVQFTGRLVTGTPSTVVVSTVDRVALLTFAAPVGKRTSLVLRDSTFGSTTSNARVSVYRPDGSTAVSATGFGSSGLFLEPLTSSTANAYTVLIDPQGTATGQVVVAAYDVPSDPTVPAAADGSTATVVTSAPGQNAAVTVSGTAGQRLSVALTGSTYGSSGLQVGVRRPDGTSLVSAQSVSGSGFLDQFVLPVAGTYSIFVDPVRAATGQIGVQVFDVSADATVAAPLDGTPVTVTTTMPGQNAAVTFSALAGQRISVRVAMGSNPQVAVRRPDGSTLVGAQTVYTSLLVEPFLIPAAGTYTVAINPGGISVGSAVVHVYALPDDVVVATTMGGGPVTVGTLLPGLNGRAEFPGTAGIRASVRIASHSYGSSNLRVGLRGPDGATLVSPQIVYSSSFLEPVTLPSSGTYAVTVDPTSAATGSASVQVYDVPPDPVLTTTPGSGPVIATAGVPGQNVRVEFPGVAGQRISLRVPTHSYGLGNVSVGVRKPDGTALISAQTVYSSHFARRGRRPAGPGRAAQGPRSGPDDNSACRRVPGLRPQQRRGRRRAELCVARYR